MTRAGVRNVKKTANKARPADRQVATFAAAPQGLIRGTLVLSAVLLAIWLGMGQTAISALLAGACAAGVACAIVAASRSGRGSSPSPIPVPVRAQRET
jgi:hypothetical protein